ncbi:DUF7475 family protein [Natronobiforma cellulositropha]|uniref:DUF7475 family protein n=1 Tax=Natronobiforma cellulositropha TaxID=1679076 RepID=UPI0021D57202|nr:hypothetical protein [Natronobiforma cellulositropha]
MESSAGQSPTASLTPLHWAAIALALLSGAIHLVLGVEFLPHWMGGAFLLAAGGFFGGVTLVLLDVRRRLLSLLGIPFTAGQLLFWYLLNRPVLEDPSPIGVLDKLAQVLLIAALAVLYTRES